jgi:hypothetical protein
MSQVRTSTRQHIQFIVIIVAAVAVTRDSMSRSNVFKTCRRLKKRTSMHPQLHLSNTTHLFFTKYLA